MIERDSELSIRRQCELLSVPKELLLQAQGRERVQQRTYDFDRRTVPKRPDLWKQEDEGIFEEERAQSEQEESTEANEDNGNQSLIPRT